MKHRMIWILLAGIAAGIMISGLLRRPVPASEPEAIQVLDGTGICVDNDALWRVIAGDWASADARWTLKLDGEDHLTLLLDGEAAAESTLCFSYLCPEPPPETELTVQTPQLYGSDGRETGEIVSLLHKAGAHGGTLTLELLNTDDKTEILTFQKEE